MAYWCLVKASLRKNNQAMQNLQEENDQLQDRVEKLEQLVNALLAEKANNPLTIE